MIVGSEKIVRLMYSLCFHSSFFECLSSNQFHFLFHFFHLIYSNLFILFCIFTFPFSLPPSDGLSSVCRAKDLPSLTLCCFIHRFSSRIPARFPSYPLSLFPSPPRFLQYVSLNSSNSYIFRQISPKLEIVKTSADPQIGSNICPLECPCGAGRPHVTLNDPPPDFFFSHPPPTHPPASSSSSSSSPPLNSSSSSPSPTPSPSFSSSDSCALSNHTISTPSSDPSSASSSDIKESHQKCHDDSSSHESPSDESLTLSNFTFLCSLISYLPQADQSDLYSRLGKNCRLNIEHLTNSLRLPSENVRSEGLEEGTRGSSFLPLSALISVAGSSDQKWKENEREIEEFYKKGISLLIQRGDMLMTPATFTPLTTSQTPLPVD